MPANYVLLSEQTVSASVTSLTFSNIPQTGYTDLIVKFSARTDRINVDQLFTVRFNGSSSSLSSRRLEGSGSSATSNTDNTEIYALGTGNSATANTFGNCEIYIPNYTSSNFKSVSIDGVSETNATDTTTLLLAGLWSNTAAITSITLTPNGGQAILANSTFSLYGVAALGTTPVIAPKASGGDIIVNDGTYWYHAFLGSGVFTPNQTLSCDALVVAGGGGANADSSGGGGAGGLLAFTSQSLIAQNYTCTVGAGGAYATNGANSQFSSLTASVGGGHGSGITTNYSPGSGGSGGGGSGGGSTTAGTGTAGQGNNGGAGFSSASPYGGGGGGGAGAVGNAGRSTSDGAGGIGATSALINAMGSATSTGELSGGNYYYAGGGGGNGGLSTAGVGGLGGGGTGQNSSTTTSTNGTANTGGGAGGGNQTQGRTGGSGIIIIRYTMA
jgi:hypothetical protein